MDALAIVLFIISGGLILLQLILAAQFSALIKAGRSGSMPLWPLITAVVASIYGALRILG